MHWEYGSRDGRFSLPRAKKAKRSAPVCQVSAEEQRAKQFKEDLFVDSGFCTADLVSTA